ncbi:hypothetical protein [Paradevosia shaoguanensis]|uniref:hypothetical protein n=1 Tax=Paradevosia shaoguanensis TaxID=1335043 RepID=UPI003C786C1B
MQLPYPINLLGAYELEEGDVITRDGEIVGTWTLIHGALYDFTPIGGDQPILTDPFVWRLCNRIGEWLEAQELAHKAGPRLGASGSS